MRKGIQKQNEWNEEEWQIFADEEKYKWEKSLLRHTEKEKVEIYSPPPEMIAAALDAKLAERAAILDEMKRALVYIYTSVDKDSRWFGEMIVKMLWERERIESEQHIRRLQRICPPKDSRLIGNIQDENIERGRKYPIYDIAKYRLDLKSCGNKYSSLCPFHKEKHASFYIYLETNTYNCFGCGANGNIIKLTMHLYNASFQEAVQMLQ